MIPASNIGVLALLTCLVLSGCTGSEPGAPPEELGVPSDGSIDVVLSPADEVVDADSAADRAGERADAQQTCSPAPAAGLLRAIGADSLEACSYSGGEDRVAFHHHDTTSETCVDLILIRTGQGGVLPDGFRAGFDWGVGHMSAYRCDAAGERVGDACAMAFNRATGNVGVGGGGYDGLPVSMSLELTLSVAGTEQFVLELSVPTIDVSPTCDATSSWARQALNVQEEVPPLEIRGCTNAAPERLVAFQQRDPSRGICADVILVPSDPVAPAASGLSLPEGWQVEYMSSFHCSVMGQANVPGSTIAFTRASGWVGFGGDRDGVPVSAGVDITLSAPAEDVNVSLDAYDSRATQRLHWDTVDVSAACPFGG